MLSFGIDFQPLPSQKRTIEQHIFLGKSQLPMVLRERTYYRVFKA